MSTTISPLYSSSVSIPITNQTSESVKTPSTYGNSEISKAESAPLTGNGLHSPPQLTPLLLLHLMNDTYAVGSKLLESAAYEIKFFSESLGKRAADCKAALLDAARKTQQLGTWSTLERIGACILSGFNFAVGYSLYASGSNILGTTLIAAGILSVANIAMSEVQGWNFVAKQLAMGNKEYEDRIRFWGPMIGTAAPLALTGWAGLYDPSLLSQATSFDWQKSAELYNGFTTAGKSYSQASLYWVQSVLSEIQSAVTGDKLLRDAIIAWMETLTQTLQAGWEQARSIIQITSQVRM